MRTVAITHPQRPARWLVFLAGAVCVLEVGLGVLPQERPRDTAIEMPQLRVSLLTRAAPTPPQVTEPVLVSDRPLPDQPMTNHPAPPVVAPRPSVVTHKPAVRKIAPPEKRVPTETTAQPPIRPTLDAVRLARKPPVPKPAKREAPEAPPQQEAALTSPPAPVPESADMPDTGAAVKTQTASVIEEARYRRQTPPVYPRRSLDLGEQGVVMLHVSVLSSGAPDEVKVQESSGFRRLDLAAMAAVRKWEFEPTLARAERKITWVRVPVRFVIRNN